MLKLAQHILQSKATDFDPSQFVDHYEAMRVKDMVALGRVVLAKRERVIMLQPWQRSG